jgi:hypothetical protein
MDEIVIEEAKRYQPNPDLVQYIKGELRMKEIRRIRENAGEDLSPDEKKLERNLDKRKSTWMNKIFQITADLIFFFECIAAKEELSEEFKDEYDDLFGFGFDDAYIYYTDVDHENPLRRLVFSLLQVNSTGFLNASMTATYVTQKAIYEKMRKVVSEDIEITDPEIAGKITSDILYCLAWVRFVSKPTTRKTRFRREIDSQNPVLRNMESHGVTR